MIKILPILIFLISFYSSAQNDSIIKGKVTSESSNLEGIHVINRSAETGVVTIEGGYFTIKAKVSDTIVFSAVHLKAVVYFVKKEDFNENLLFVNMESMISELNEVVLTKYKNINAVSLGIVPANQRTYTPAERKLYTAEKFKWYSPLLIPVGGMSVDGLINSVSGRTKMLKKEVEVEKKEFLLESIRLDFRDNYFIERLKIPEDYVSGFLYYLIENRNFVIIYGQNNKTAIEFALAGLSVEYLKLKNLDIKDEIKTEK